MEAAIHLTEIKYFIRKYNEHLYASKFHNLNDMNKFLERCRLMKQTEERENVHKGPRREWIGNPKIATSQEEYLQARWLHSWIRPNIWRRTNRSPLPTLRKPEEHVMATRHCVSCMGVQGHFGQGCIGKQGLHRGAAVSWEIQQTGRCQSGISALRAPRGTKGAAQEENILRPKCPMHSRSELKLAVELEQGQVLGVPTQASVLDYRSWEVSRYWANKAGSNGRGQKMSYLQKWMFINKWRDSAAF